MTNQNICMTNFLLSIDNNMFYVYSLALLASILKNREFCSLSLTTLIVLVANLTMLQIRDPLLTFANSTGDMAWQVWFGAWAMANLFVISSLYLSHRRLNISTSKVSSIVSLHFVALCALQCVGYVDEVYFNTNTLDLVYRFGIPTINISIGITILGFLVFRSEQYARFYRRVTRV